MEPLSEEIARKSIQICKDDINRLISFERKEGVVKAIKWNQGVIKVMRKYLKTVKEV